MLTIMLWEQDLGYGITNKNQILNILMKKTDNIRIWI